ncbi:MAG: YybS family protein [Treponema sp.]|jgi:hypothetical protein|nr:YybS family protein [Treponema sp.]
MPRIKTGGIIASIPALICGALSVGLIQSQLPTFFFLVPLGFMAYSYNLPSVWVSLGVGVLGNGLVSLSLRLGSSGANKYIIWMDILYFALMMVVFTWIVAPPIKRLGKIHLSLPYRFILGSVIGALSILFIIETTQNGFNEFLHAQGEMLSSIYKASASTDVVQHSLLEQYVTPETLAKVLGLVLLRGGGLVSCMMIFFISRQISLLLVRLIRRITVQEHISNFYTPPWLIWVLSFSLLGIVLSKLAALAPLEIVVWNIAAICGILYLAQGWGIVWCFLSQRNLSPLTRLVITGLIIFLIFSPGINLFSLGLLILLGIAEHWVPLRAPKTDGPSSTPGM